MIDFLVKSLFSLLKIFLFAVLLLFVAVIIILIIDVVEDRCCC